MAFMDKVVNSQLKLQEKPKLALIHKTKLKFEEQLPVDDMIKVYNMNGMDKCRVCSTYKIVLSVPQNAFIVHVMDKNSKFACVAVEYTQMALSKSDKNDYGFLQQYCYHN